MSELKQYLYHEVVDLKDDLPKLKNLIKEGLALQELSEFVTDKWIEEVISDKQYEEYAIQSIINMASSLAKKVKYNQSLLEITGYFLPSVDLIKGKERFGQVEVKGLRIPFITDDGKIILLNKWSMSDNVHLFADSEKPENEQRKIPIPYFQHVKIRTNKSVSEQWGESYQLMYIVSISTEWITTADLRKIIEANSITPDKLSKNYAYKFIILKDVTWRFCQSLEEWVESQSEVDKIAKIDPVTKQNIVKQNPITGQVEVQYDIKPKMVTVEGGQPLFQEKDGSSDNPVEVLCFNLALGIEEQLPISITTSFTNNRYGCPAFWIYGKKGTIKNARLEGDGFDPANPQKNPFSRLNNAYIGTKLFILGFVDNAYESKKVNEAGIKPTFLNIQAMMILAEDFQLLPSRQIELPKPFTPATMKELPENFYLKNITPVVSEEVNVQVVEELKVESEQYPHNVHIPQPPQTHFVVKEEPANYSVDDSDYAFSEWMNENVLSLFAQQPEVPMEDLIAVHEELPFYLLNSELFWSADEKHIQMIDSTATEEVYVNEQLREFFEKYINDNEIESNFDNENELAVESENPNESAANTTEFGEEQNQIKQELEDFRNTLHQILTDIGDTSYQELKELPGILPDSITDDHEQLINQMIEQVKKEMK